MSKYTLKQLSLFANEVCTNTNLILRVLEEVGEINYYSFILNKIEFRPDYLICSGINEDMVKYFYSVDNGIILVVARYGIVVNLTNLLVKLQKEDLVNYSLLQEYLSTVLHNWNILSWHIISKLEEQRVA